MSSDRPSDRLSDSPSDNHSDSDANNNPDSGSDRNDSDSNTGDNSGTMIVDATCAPSHIRYPQDVSLLNEARENAEKLVDVLHDPDDGKKPCTSPIARSVASGCPARHWAVPKRTRSEIRRRTIGMNANGWKWSAGSVWPSANVSWDWSRPSYGIPLPMSLPCPCRC